VGTHFKLLYIPCLRYFKFSASKRYPENLMNKFSIPNTYNFIYRTYSRTGEGLSPSWASCPSSINFSDALCNMYMNAKMNKQPEKLLREVEANLFTKRRLPGVQFGYDSSRIKVTRQRTRNWLGQSLSKITVPWTQSVLSRDQIRVLLKNHFYPASWRVT